MVASNLCVCFSWTPFRPRLYNTRQLLAIAREPVSNLLYHRLFPSQVHGELFGNLSLRLAPCHTSGPLPDNSSGLYNYLAHLFPAEQTPATSPQVDVYS